MVPDPADPLGQTRTVRAGWLERLFVAPNRVQYHLEHHLLMTVPHYNLPKFHEMLRDRGVLDGCLRRGQLRTGASPRGRLSLLGERAANVVG